MKLIIDIEDNVYDDIEHNKGEYINTLNWAVRNGTPYEERPKGKWKVYPMPSSSGFGLTIGIECPFCGYEVDEKYDFCVCGADMREDGSI